MTTDLNRTSYNRIAHQWDKARSVLTERERPYFDVFVAALPDSASILDLGCGTGRPIAEQLLARGHQVTGVDQATSLLGTARTRFPSATWIESSIEAFETALRFDAVVCWDALFHVPRELHEGILHRVVWYLKPGGRLMMTVGGSEHPAFTDTMFGQTFFYDSHTPAETLQILTRLNCRPITADFINIPDGQRDKGRFAIVAERRS